MSRVLNCTQKLRTPFGLLLATVILVGCGDTAAVPRYPVSGNVTFQGQPVPYGTIFFEPDSKDKTGGPSGFAEIRNGEYHTTPDFGSITGSVRARINGTDGKGEADSTNPNGMQLFPEYVVSVEIPAKESTQDFEVPARSK